MCYRATSYYITHLLSSEVEYNTAKELIDALLASVIAFAPFNHPPCALGAFSALKRAFFGTDYLYLIFL